MAEKDLGPNGLNDRIESTPSSPVSKSPKAGSTRSSDLDDNYAIYQQNAGQDSDPAEERRVLRKIDRRLVPILILIYFLQYIDKNGINYASVYGLQKGTNLHGQDFSWLGSIFYFGEHPTCTLRNDADCVAGYLASQFPAGYVIQRLPLGKVIGVTTIIWGIILITTPACTSFAGIATNRFLLGFFESVVNPGFV